MTRDQEAHIKHLWEDTETTAMRIGSMYGVSKNVIVGMVHRRRWKPRLAQSTERHRVANERKTKITPLSDIRKMRTDGIELNGKDLADLPGLSPEEEAEYPHARTTMGRLDALNATMDAVVAASRGPEMRVPDSVKC